MHMCSSALCPSAPVLVYSPAHAPALLCPPQCIRALNGIDWNGRRLLVETARNPR